MLKLNKRSENFYMPEFGLYGRIAPNPNLSLKLERWWEGSASTKEPSLIDTKTLAKELQNLKKENEELKNRLRKIEVEISKKHIIGIRNLILSDDAIDEIWGEEDDTL